MQSDMLHFYARKNNFEVYLMENWDSVEFDFGNGELKLIKIDVIYV